MTTPATLLHGDCRAVLAGLPADSVHCAVTSPPYWGLRSYAGLEPSVWGGDAKCRHEWQQRDYYTEKSAGRASGEAFHEAGADNAARLRETRWRHDETCKRCGAWLGHLGLEPTPDAYVAHIVEVMEAVRRVLRPDGTAWVNLGDSYFAGGNGARDAKRWPKQSRNNGGGRMVHGKKGPHADLKPKDLVGMPWRVALALQAAGWWLRRDMVWRKDNPMPESVTDRPSSSHEYIFLLSKRDRYYWDSEAVREASTERPSGNKARKLRGDYGGADGSGAHRGISVPYQPNGTGRNMRDVWSMPTQSFGMEMCRACTQVYTARQYRGLRNGSAPQCQFEVVEGEACGNVQFQMVDAEWMCLACDTGYTVKGLATLPKSARCRCGRDDSWLSHFATFPEELPRRCILAGTSERGVCAECGAPQERVVERTAMEIDRTHNHPPELRTRTSGTMTKPPTSTTTGWRPTCAHDADTVPAMVLDPFVGSGTTCYVAWKLGRRSIGIDASAEYLTLARKRLEALSLPMEMP